MGWHAVPLSAPEVVRTHFIRNPRHKAAKLSQSGDTSDCRGKVTCAMLNHSFSPEQAKCTSTRSGPLACKATVPVQWCPVLSLPGLHVVSGTDTFCPTSGPEKHSHGAGGGPRGAGEGGGAAA